MAPSNALTVEEIINGFPNPILPKIYHEPTFEDIQVKTRLFNTNAISFPFHRWQVVVPMGIWAAS
jgi:hypothetical protein